MKKNLLLISILFLFTGHLFAGTAYPYPVQIQQADGSVITVILQGDEKLSWAKTTDDFTLLYNDEGIYEYGIKDASGDLVPSGIKAHDVADRSPSEMTFLASVPKNLFFSNAQTYYLSQISDMYKTVNADKSVSAFPTMGNAKLLCILIGFSDMAFTETQANFNNLFNQVGYGTYGSVKDYYEENSYQQFHLTVDVAGPYQAVNTHAYYGQNSGDDKDINVREFVTEAVTFAEADIDFTDYDNDGDGNVDGVYIIYAGYNEAEGGGANSIWYHAWSIPTINLDGVNVSSYSCSAEYKGNSGTAISGIGNICHEFGHVMGAPDFYDTNYGTDGQYPGMGEWDVMASGNFNGGRDCPAHYNPYTKSYLFGWSDITILSSQQEMTLLNSALNNNQFYRYNTATAGEYFLMENKQQLGFDAEIPGHGLMIYHVHSDIASGSINVTHPQKHYPVCSNAGTDPALDPHSYMDAATGPLNWTINSPGTPFPGSGGNSDFTDATLPSSKSWAGDDTEKEIAFITENTGNNTVSFCFMGCPPVADFVADDLNPCEGDVVHFTDLSTYSPYVWTWTFTPDVTYTDGTDRYSQNPHVIFNTGGEHMVSLSAENDYGIGVEFKNPYIDVNTAPTISLNPASQTKQWGDAVTFSSTANGDPAPSVQWQLSTDGGGIFNDISGETNTSLELSCLTLGMDGYQYRAVFTNVCGTEMSAPAILSVTEKMVTCDILIDPNPQQYSDIVDIYLTIPNGFTCGEAAASGADIYIGTQFMGTVSFTHPGSDLIAVLNDVILLEPIPYGTDPTGQMAPGDREVTAVLAGVNSNFMIDNPGETLTIDPEDALAYYTGAVFSGTVTAYSQDAVVTLSATIKDITAELTDPLYDPNPGDIRNAKVTFINRDNNTVIAQNIPIGLVSNDNTMVGTATYDWEVTISDFSETFTIGIIVTDYYTRDDPADNTVITVAQPAAANTVSGGGYLVLTESSGMTAGDFGSKNNFGFNAKYNKSGKKLQGKINTIVRRTETDGLHTYHIKSPKLSSISVAPTPDGGIATLNGKAVITDITDPLMPIEIEGNGSIQLEMEDHGEPGVEDLISITIWNRDGGLWYASNWDGTSTVLQLLDAGNIQVHANNSFKITSEEESGSFDCMVYPNPNNGQFTLELNGETNDVYHIKVTDLVGHEFYIESILAPKGGSTHSFDLTKFSNGMYIMSIENDKERKLITVMVQN